MVIETYKKFSKFSVIFFLIITILLNFYFLYSNWYVNHKINENSNINIESLKKWENKKSELLMLEDIKNEIKQKCKFYESNYETCWMEVLIQHEEKSGNDNFRKKFIEYENFIYKMESKIVFFDFIVYQDYTDYFYMIPWFLLILYILLLLFVFFVLKIIAFFYYRIENYEDTIESLNTNEKYNESYLNFVVFNKGIYKYRYVNRDFCDGLFSNHNPWTSYLKDKENLKLQFTKNKNYLITMILTNHELQELQKIILEEFNSMRNDYFLIIKSLKILNNKIKNQNKDYQNGIILIENIEKDNVLYSKFKDLENDIEYSKEIYNDGIKMIQDLSQIIKENFVFSKKLFVMFELTGTLLDYEPNYTLENKVQNIVEYSNKDFIYSF